MIQVKIGDILIFEAHNDYISKAIAWITESKYSHAAMVYDTNSIVEMGLSGIGVSEIYEGSDNKALLLRMESVKDTQPLHDIAEKYITAKTRYDFPALVLLGLMLIYKHIRPTSRLVVITDIILRKACTILDNMLQKIIIHNPDKAMVCSQLVCQVYSECGKDYEIKFSGASLQKSNKGIATNSDTICLLDLSEDAADFKGDLMLGNNSSINNDDEQLAEELYKSLIDQNKSEEILLSSNDLSHVSSVVKKFLELINDILVKAKIDIPLDALFISPEDIANKSTNLKKIGELSINRK